MKKVLAGAVLFSLVLLLLCSQCSPLYPLNIWDDANCLLTVGRAMRHGAVLYRDIYEQKGPLLYVLHALAAWMTESSFLGVFILEVLFLAGTLAVLCRTLGGWSLRGLSAAALCMALTVASPVFCQGDSAEEFSLIFLCVPLMLTRRTDGRLGAREAFVCGACAGCVAMIKYSMLGLFAGLCLGQLALLLGEGRGRELPAQIGAFAAGALVVLAPVTAVLLSRGALGAAVEAYIVNNIFHYALRSDLSRMTELLRGNALYLLALLAGLVLCVRRLREHRRETVLCLAMAAGQLLMIAASRIWAYSLLAMAPFLVLVPWGLQEGARRLPGAVYALALPAALALAGGLTPNAYLRGIPLDNTAQGRLATYMYENATLLQYSHLDDGLYLTSGALPVTRFFVRLNVDFDEMNRELDRYLVEAVPDFVLVSWRELPPEFDRYHLIATDATYDDSGRMNKLLYLYRRVEV